MKLATVSRTAYSILRSCSRISFNLPLKDTFKLHVRTMSMGHMDFKLQFNPAFEVREPTISLDKKQLGIGWKSDGQDSQFYSLWLRHQCHCEECFQASSGQNLVHPDFLIPPISLEQVQRDSDALSIVWKYEDGLIHKGFIPLQWLYQSRSKLKKIESPNFLLHELTFDEVLSNDEGLYKYLSLMNQHGVVKVINAPGETGGLQLADHISHRLNSFYGLEWDVLVVPDPVNAAYSDVELKHHMDFTYNLHQAGLQHLHCIQNDPCVDGGRLTLKDIYILTGKFRKDFPEDFHTLSTVPVVFQHITFRKRTFLEVRCPTFTLNSDGEISYIRWSPNTQGPVINTNEHSTLDAYFRAYNQFHKYVESYPPQAEFFYKPGDVVSFHNFRMVHGRTKIVLNGGVRHLKGCYTPIDEFQSKLRYLSVKLGKEIPQKIY